MEHDKKTEKMKMMKKKGMHSVDSSEKDIKEADASMTSNDGSAAQSIEAKPSDASKAGMMAQAMTSMAAMDKSQLDQVLQMMNSKQFASTIPDGAADQNRASVAMKSAVKEDVAELFGSEELSETFKEKATVLFEAAVNARLIHEVEQLEEAYQQRLEEEVENIAESLSEQIDHYLSFATKEWMTENKVAVESSLKNELAEQFITGLRNLFAEHYVQFPEEQVDVVEALAEKVEELESQLNEQINKNIELDKLVEDHQKQEIFAQVAEGLALTQVDKFRTLAEGIDFDSDAEKYQSKLAIIKENYFGVKTKPSLINEQVDAEDQEPAAKPVFLEPQIENYARAISRTIKR